MKKIIVLIILAIMVFTIGCSGKQDRTLVSRPVTKDTTEEPMYTIEPAKDEPTYVAPKVEKEPEPTYVAPSTTTSSSSSSGTNTCDVLSGTEVAGFLGGAYIKASNCPVNPMMPKGVTVCQCAYDWKTNFVDVEVQTYTDGSQERVFNMYCSSTNVAVGDKACTWTSPSDVEFVYFLSGDKFVKVSCRGICDSNKLVNMAKSLESKI